MPVHRQKKDTTPNTSGSTPEQTAPALPEQRAFHQHLRELARGAIRVVLEGVMREELDALIGVGWGESSPRRKGYRNGSYTRDLVTTTGRIEDLQVPRDREGQFHTQVFERYRRYEPQVAQGLTEMFVAGASTHKVGEVAQTLMGVAPSASTISRLNQSLTQQFEAWRQRPLQTHWRVLYLDGVHFSIRHGDKADSTIIVTALGVDLTGNKEVLALRACAEESKEGWLGLLQDLRGRGATQIDLIVTDGHDGLLAAVGELLRPRLANVVSCISSAMRSLLSLDESAAMSKPNWWVFGSNRPSRRHWLNWQPSKPNTRNAIQRQFAAWLRMKITS
jgi:putative transposase